MKLLLICQDNIGDLVFTTALINAIAKAQPNTEIQLLTRTDTAQVAEFFAHVNGIYPQVSLARLNPVTRLHAIKAFFTTRTWLRSQHFEVAISVSKNWRLGVLMQQAHIPVRIGFAYPKLKYWLTHAISLPDLHQPVVPELLTLLKPLNIHTKLTYYALDLATVLARCKAELPKLERSKQQSGKPWFGLHAFASQSNRCVSLTSWLTLAAHLIQQDIQPIWFGAPQDMQQLRDYNQQHNQQEYIGDFCDTLGNGQLAQSIPLLSLCDAYIGHDSGILHLASAIGLKTLGIFTPGEPQRTFAQGIGDGKTFYWQNPSEVSGEQLIAQAKICFNEYFI